MKIIHPPKITGLRGCLFAAASLLLTSLPSSATLVDPFTNTVKTGWTDFASGGGSLSYAPHAFGVTSSSSSTTPTYSKYTAATFSYQSGHTLEIKVKVNGIGPAGAANGHAVLAWVPTGQPLLSSSLNVRVGVGDIQIRNGSTALPGGSLTLSPNLPTTNVFVVLRITPDGANQIITASVYNQAIWYSPPFNSSLLFEHTVTNTTAIGTAGNLALGAENSPSGAAATVSFDRLEVFDAANVVLDPLTGARTACAPCGGALHNGWFDAVSNPNAYIKENANNQLEMGWPYDPSLFICLSMWNNQTFSITEGARVQFSVDVPVGNQGFYSAPILMYTRSSTDASSLVGYYLAQNSVLVGAGKSFAGYSWISPFAAVPTPPNSGVRFTQIMTGEGGGTQVRVESRIEDLSKDINDPTRVIVRTEQLDGPAFGGAYTNANGYFSLVFFHNSKTSGQVEDTVAFTNATVSYTIPANRAPIISGLIPKDGANFVGATTAISFQAADDVSMPTANLVLTLNGVAYTNGSPGVSVTGTTATKTFSLAGALSPNVFYRGSISAADNTSLATIMHYEFDTFLTNNFVVESEEYNFSLDFTTGGSYLDNPVLIAQGNTDSHAYNGQEGIANVDFHDNQGSLTASDHVFRADPPWTDNSTDGPREKYVNSGGAASGFYEVVVADVANDDWLNYSHGNYPAGTFNAYLRQSQFNLLQSLVTLERVLSDRTQISQTTSVLGSFTQLGDTAGDTGFDIQRNVPLTDASGNPMVLRLSGGLDTLRVNDRFVDDHNSVGAILFQNYMVLVPVADPGTLRPVVTMSWPAANAIFRYSPMQEQSSASIANRDTSVVSNTIALSLNGVAMPITIQMVTNPAGTEKGAEITWPLTSVPAAAVLNAKLTFQDNLGTPLTNTWSYRYPFLRASNSLPAGSVNATNLGWDYQMAQTDGGGLGTSVEINDSITRAIQQLENPPEIAPDRTYLTNNLQVLQWNDSLSLPCPGLDLAQQYYNIAVRALGYMRLAAGAHRFSLDCDDGWEMWLGFNLNDPNQQVIAVGPNLTATFDFFVEADGYYPIQLIWQNSRKNYHFSLHSVDLSNNTQGPLINDTGSPVQVYSPSGAAVLPMSSATLNGPFTIENSAVVNQAARTVTVPKSSSARFFKIYGTASPAITTITTQVVGSNVVLHY